MAERTCLEILQDPSGAGSARFSIYLAAAAEQTTPVSIVKGRRDKRFIRLGQLGMRLYAARRDYS